METKYDVLDGMKGMRKYSWMRPSLVNVPGLMDGTLTFSVREPVSEKGKNEVCRWIMIDEICRGEP
jgi:hypothetical protein